MTRPRWRLSIKQGETLRRYFRMRDATGTVLDFADISVTTGTLVIRDTYGGTEIITLTTDNGGVSLTAGTKSNGWEYSGYIEISAATAGELVEWGDGVFDFEVSDGIREKVIADGIAVLDPTTIT